MSFFNLFKKKEKGPTIVDKVWINQAAKERGCIQLVKDNPHLVLVAWSSVTFDRFQQLLHEENGLPTELTTVRSAMPSRMHGKAICFLEHHLFLHKETSLLESWKCENPIFLNCLEDPVFYSTNPERIVALMEKMGHQEDEIIEHAMVTKSIQQAQQKMEKQGGIDGMPDLVKEWWKGIR